MSTKLFPKLATPLVAIAAVSIIVLATHARAPATQVPSLREFFQQLVEQYSPGVLPKYEQVLQVVDTIPNARANAISEALPAIFAALGHSDVEVKIDAAFALTTISRRPDGAALLGKYIKQIGLLFDLTDPRLQATPALIFSNLKPAPPAEVVPLMVKFLLRTDREEAVQTGAIFSLVRLAPEEPEVESAILEFLSRPLETKNRIGALNALGNPGIKDPLIIKAMAASLEDADLFVCLTSIRALERVGPNALQQAQAQLQRAFKRMQKLLSQPNGDFSMQVQAASVLTEFGPEGPQNSVSIRNFFSRPLGVGPRIGALHSIANPRTRDPQLIKMVVGFLADPNKDVRLTTIQTIRRIGKNALVQAQKDLQKISEDPTQPSELRQAAREALRTIN